jgi:hypothetical protein
MIFSTLLLPLTYPRSFAFSLNPGPWNVKEHALVFIMANVAIGNPYALNAIVVSEIFYKMKIEYWLQVTFVLATQLTGFGFAGMCRRFLVWPASMVWPQNLVACALLNTLHVEDDGEDEGKDEDEDGQVAIGLERRDWKSVSRYRFFMIVMVGAFLFFFLPGETLSFLVVLEVWLYMGLVGFLFKALSTFSFICWAAPTNIPINQIFGVRTGLGFSVITFDWSQIAWIGSPLMGNSCFPPSRPP